MSHLSRRGFFASTFIIGGSAAILGACTVAPAGTDVAVVRVAPPPPRYEAPPPLPPQRAAVEYWQPGHWRWNGNEHVWVPGHYAARPHPGAVWVAPRWESRGGGWVFVDGRWT